MTESISALRAGGSLLSVEQVADFLSVSRLTVYRLIERRVLPVYRVARRLRFDPGDLARYLRSARTPEEYAGPQN